jgi:hypothetical protein
MHSELTTLYGGFIIGLFINILNNVPWTCVFLLLQFFGIRLYVLKNRDDCLKLQKKVGKWSSHITDNNRAHGYSFGFWYIMSIDISYDFTQVWIISTERTYNKLIDNSNEDEKIDNTDSDTSCVKKQNNNLRIIEKSGSYTNVYFTKRTLDINTQPYSEQKEIIDSVTQIYKKKKFGIVVIQGKPGTGKSMVPFLLANSLNGYYCNSLKPWSPGEKISNLYNEFEITNEKPLIIAFDEFDVPLQEINIGIAYHLNVPISVTNKQGWNQMLDEIQKGMFPNLILIMTTNKSLDVIKSMDESYIRRGRVDEIYTMNTTVDYFDQ